VSPAARLVLLVALAGCTSDNDVCAPFGLVEDPVRARCVCPNGFAMDDDAGACVGPDGSVIRYDAGRIDDADAGFDAPPGCVVGVDGCECSERDTRPCDGGSSVGSCSPGTQRCVAGRWSECEGRIDATPEVCNGADDDCNGTPDDGSARTSCATTARTLAAGCSGGGCFVETCVDGFLDCDSDFENGCESELGSTSTCLACGDRCGWSCGVAGCNDARTVAAGGAFTCTIREDRTVACWGRNSEGSLGDGTTTPRGVAAPVSTLEDVDSIGAGFLHACATTGGSVWCWGDNQVLQLGDGTQTQRDSPQPVSVWCWGNNDQGSLGVPVIPVARGVVRSGMTNATAVAPGRDHTCALRADGTVWCWGANTQGSLGNGAPGVSSVAPVQVSGITTARAIASGEYFSCAVLSNGTVRCWGLVGGLSVSTPTTISGLSEVASISAGGPGNVCALDSEGSLWCWGINRNGEVGDGTTMVRSDPVNVHSDVVRVSNGYGHTCAVLRNGGVRCWGLNEDGQLGDGTAMPRTSPTDVLPSR
jgi:alpha-tubulin suppressor-like RCC1 family protein